MSVREVRASALVKRLSEELKKLKELTPPEWSHFVKTGTHNQRPPEQPDWWYTRAASLLRRIFIDGPVGVQRLRSYYGGRKTRGVAPEHFRRASGKILRTLLQQLDKAGLVVKTERGGRKLTAKGANMLTAIANSMKDEQTKAQGE
jgi:small subunit ribosomal protein S19e